MRGTLIYFIALSIFSLRVGLQTQHLIRSASVNRSQPHNSDLCVDD